MISLSFIINLLGPFIIAHQSTVECAGELNELTRDCVTDTSGNCLNVDRSSSLSYVLAQESQNNMINAQKFEFDKLSDRDYIVFKSKSPEYWEAEDQKTTMRQVLLIHRHGDRTPISFAPRDKLVDESFWTFHGLGQLTNRGKARMSMLGKILRMRYNKFLDGSVNKNNRKTRSSGALRCIESAQVLLSSFLGLDSTGSPDASDLVWDRDDNERGHLWQPASIYTVSAEMDGMLNEGAVCKNINREYEIIDQSDGYKQLSEEYRAEASLIETILGFNMDHFYKWFWCSSFLEVERSYFEDKVDMRLRKAFDRIDKAGDQALVLYQSTPMSRRLRAGLLINDMIDNMVTFREAANLGLNSYQTSSIKKFVHYSAHDLNLIVLLGMFENIEKYPFRPDYASNILLELHEDSQDGEWFVKIFYMSHVPSKYVELHIASCEQAHPKARCTLDRFNEFMGQYKVNNWQDWMKECGDDLNSVDPYKQNS